VRAAKSGDAAKSKFARPIFNPSSDYRVSGDGSVLHPDFVRRSIPLSTAWDCCDQPIKSGI